MSFIHSAYLGVHFAYFMSYKHDFQSIFVLLRLGEILFSRSEAYASEKKSTLIIWNCFLQLWKASPVVARNLTVCANWFCPLDWALYNYYLTYEYTCSYLFLASTNFISLILSKRTHTKKRTNDDRSWPNASNLYAENRFIEQQLSWSVGAGGLLVVLVHIKSTNKFHLVNAQRAFAHLLVLVFAGVAQRVCVCVFVCFNVDVVYGLRFFFVRVRVACCCVYSVATHLTRICGLFVWLRSTAQRTIKKTTTQTSHHVINVSSGHINLLIFACLPARCLCVYVCDHVDSIVGSCVACLMIHFLVNRRRRRCEMKKSSTRFRFTRDTTTTANQLPSASFTTSAYNSCIHSGPTSRKLCANNSGSLLSLCVPITDCVCMSIPTDPFCRHVVFADRQFKRVSITRHRPRIIWLAQQNRTTTTTTGTIIRKECVHDQRTHKSELRREPFRLHEFRWAIDDRRVVVSCWFDVE